MAVFRKPAPVAVTVPSPERIALSHAIEANTAAKAAHTNAVAALANADQAWSDAAAARASAERALDEAGPNAINHLRDVARGIAGAPPQTVRQAREALQEATENDDAAYTVRNDLRSVLEELKKERDYPKTKLREAAHAVIRGEWQDHAVNLAADVERLQRYLVNKAAELEWLIDIGMFPRANGVYEQRRILDQSVKRTHDRWQLAPGSWVDLVKVESPVAVAPWEAAVAALQADPNAPLPPGRGS